MQLFVISRRFHHGAAEGGYYGEVVITSYDELTNIIEGEIRGELIKDEWPPSNEIIQINLRGGKFRGQIK